MATVAITLLPEHCPYSNRTEEETGSNWLNVGHNGQKLCLLQILSTSGGNIEPTGRMVPYKLNL